MKLLPLLALLVATTVSAEEPKVGSVADFFSWDAPKQNLFMLGVLSGNSLTTQLFNLPIEQEAAECHVSIGQLNALLVQHKDVLVAKHPTDPAAMMVIVEFYGVCGIDVTKYLRRPGIQASYTPSPRTRFMND